MQVGEITAAAAGNKNFLSDLLAPFDDQNAPAAFARLNGAHQTGGAATDNDYIVMEHQLIKTRTSLDGFGSTSGSASPFAERERFNAYAAKQQGAARDAFAKFPTKADVARNDLFDQRWSVWGAAYGGGSTTDGNAALGSNNARRARSASPPARTTGSRRRRWPALRWPAAAPISASTASAPDGRTCSRPAPSCATTSVAAYVTGALAYGWQDVTTDRTVTVAGVDRLRAEFNANAWSGRVEGGYRTSRRGWASRPMPPASSPPIDLPAYAEQVLSGSNTFALNYAAKDVTASRTELGVRADKSFAMQNAILTLRGRAAWAHDFNTDRSITAMFQTLPGATFVVNGAAQAPTPR